MKSVELKERTKSNLACLATNFNQGDRRSEKGILECMDGRRIPCEVLEPAGNFKHRWIDKLGCRCSGYRKKILIKYLSSQGKVLIRRVVEKRILKNNDGSYVKPPHKEIG